MIYDKESDERDQISENKGEIFLFFLSLGLASEVPKLTQYWVV